MMKKTMLMMAVALFVTAMFAQSSLYDLAYDAPLKETVSALKAKGFVVTLSTDKVTTLGSKDDEELPVIKLYANTDGLTLSSWTLTYDLNDHPDLAEFVLTSLEALHGEASVVNDYDYDYIWYFNDNKAIYVSYYANDSITLEYTYGNWDDDDYYYYYDEY